MNRRKFLEAAGATGVAAVLPSYSPTVQIVQEEFEFISFSVVKAEDVVDSRTLITEKSATTPSAED